MVEGDKTGNWVGFDLGGTKMMSVVYDCDFKRLGHERKKSRGHEGAAAGLDRICQTIRESLQQASVEASDLLGIGIGCPGPLDLSRGVLLEAPNLGWKEVPIKERLEQEFSCPVAVANDVDAGVFGEYRFGAGRGARCLVGLFPGTGIGGGCVYEGKIFHGSRSTCMEIGHIPMFPEGPLDGCCNPGTLEAVASRLAIAAGAAQAAVRGQAPWLLENAGTDLREIRSGVLAKAAESDPTVAQVIDHAARHLGLAVVTLVHLLAPDVIVLGGGLIEAMPERMSGTIETTARDRVLPVYRDQFEIKIAELQDEATTLGAAAWAETSQS